MNTFRKRIISLFMCLMLLLSIVPFAALADSGDLSSGTPDGTPPVLTGMTLSVTTVTAPGTIDVTISATDDVSGIDYAYVSFYCEATKKDLYCNLSPTYWDSTTHEELPYLDGNLHGTIKIDQYLETGTFLLSAISLRDIAGNYSYYSASPYSSDLPFPDFVTQRQINVVDTEIADGTPPVLTGMTLSVTSVTAPGTIDVTISVTDDVSGIDYAYVSFYCEATKKDLYCNLSPTYWDSTTHEELPYPDGNLHGTIKIDQYLETGTFLLSAISLRDIAGNYSYYSASPYSSDLPFPDFITQQQIEVTDSGAPDGTPPVLTGMTLAATTITAPGTIDVTISATDDVSGIDYAYVSFYCEATKKDLYCNLSPTYWDSTTHEELPYPDGNLHGTIKIDQYLETGTFLLSAISLRDIAGNYSYYSASPYSSDLPFPDFVTQKQINVLNAIPDVSTSVAKPEFVEQLNNAKDDAYIVADFSGEATLPETAFTAIAGTDKTLDLVSDGVTWRFNGNDIVNAAKPIDLNVEIQPVEEHPSDAAQEIQEALKDAPAVVMQFPENGQLPGKATIQVKVDHTMREYLGSNQGLCVYYFNNQTGELELVARDLVIINDTYIEFSITHCSNYVLTAELLSDFPFVDIPNGAWYLNSVLWAVKKGITTGTTATTFSPDMDCSRGQVVTFLWRAAGSPEPASQNNPFRDVAAGDYYYKAVLWAVEKGITTGTGDGTTFSPSMACSRAQVVTFLQRFAGGAAASSHSPFADVPNGEWYTNAVLWAVEKGVTNGTGDGTTFSPDAKCTRSQIVTFLYRAIG